MIIDTSIYIPSYIPANPPTHRLAVIADTPGPTSLKTLSTFEDKADALLFEMLQRLGLNRSQIFRGYINNTPASPTASFTRLRDDLDAYKPNCILYLCPSGFGESTLKSIGLPERSISEWRGSIQRLSNVASALHGFKYIPTYTPTEVLRVYSYLPLFKFDVSRAVKESTQHELNLPKRNLRVLSTTEEIIDNLNTLITSSATVSMDIEGGVTGMTCISFSTSATEAFTIPFKDLNDFQLKQVIPVLAEVLRSPRVKKILQNCLYDNFVLSYIYKMPIVNVIHDTMLSGWEIYQELKKGLAMQTSIWTREPFYKFERKIEDDTTHYLYCARDSAVTMEICEQHQKFFAVNTMQKSHYDFNMSLLPAMLYMELKGIKYNQALAHEKLRELEVTLDQITTRLKSIGGSKFNPNSPAQVCRMLYDDLLLPIQHPKKKVGFGLDKTKRTSDTDALLDILLTTRHPVVIALLAHRRLTKQAQQLSILCDPDGRMRTSYDVTGTETGRLSSRKSPTDTGFNLQTIMKLLRVLYEADEGFEMGQFDLSGADGWTVAAWCAKLGDTTMLDDYLAGIKPAKVIALMYRGVDVASLSREQLKIACRDVTDSGPDGWQYFACKQVQHGTNYLLGISTMVTNILKSSYKQRGEPIVVTAKDCKRLQSLYLTRYFGVTRWQDYCKNQLETTGMLVSGCGNIRKFFGRRKENSTLREYVAHEPQMNTTYATNRALLKLWEDPDNRRGSVPIIQPVHQVHDALLAQWLITDREFAKAKIHQAFQTPMIIAGYEITIPYEGGFGANWKDTTQEL